jgi:4-hydroxybenzoate polyprenyltransferase
MGLNRLIDAEVDARNPRTAARELPSGVLSKRQVALLCLAAFALYLGAVFQLDPVVRPLWPIPVAFFAVYPYLKRVTWLCHFWLGAVDGLAPVGAWAAIENEIPWQAGLLGAAVALWIAGFDVLYALFDLEVDREQGLHSLPARFGVSAAFIASRAMHAGTIGFLVAAGLGLPVGAFYWLGGPDIEALLAYEHSLVSPRDWRRLDTAFFAMNGVISVGFFAFVLVDVLVS